jgi:hypothetical protein
MPVRSIAAGKCFLDMLGVFAAKLPAGMSTRCVFFDCFKN